MPNAIYFNYCKRYNFDFVKNKEKVHKVQKVHHASERRMCRDADTPTESGDTNIRASAELSLGFFPDETQHSKNREYKRRVNKE